jgi:cell shape-determining protein MreD
MRWYVLAVFGILVLALTESSFMPAFLGLSLHPDLVLIVTAVVAAQRGSDGFAMALAGGLILDLTSSVPLGLTSLSLLIGNAVATLLDRAPLPSRLFRATTWVAIVTVVAHGITLIGLAIDGRNVDVVYATTNVILPLMILNPVLAIPAFGVVNILVERARREERIAGVKR